MEILQLRILKRSQLETDRKEENMEQVGLMTTSEA